MSSTTAIGLDYGTHSTVISALPENGSQIVMQSPQGELLHPTVTYYPHDSTESIEFGAAALARLPDDNVIIQAKRAFGVTTSSLTKKSLLDSFNAKVAVPKSNQAKVKFLLTIDGQQVEKKVEDVVRDQLYYFKGIVNRDYGEKVSFVFSRPQYWSPTQTEMFGTLLEEVFGTDKIVAVVTEPNAAQFCYKVCGAVENKHMVCVFDIGCGTFDISFLRETSPGTYAGIATGGNSFLGGADMDNQLLSALEEELSVVDGFKKDVFEEQKPLLLGHMKDLKHKLSISNVGKYVVFGCTPSSYTFAVDQQKKKQILHEFYTNIEDCIHNTFTSKAKGLKKTAESVKQKAQEMKNEVDVVILVGGVMRDPLLSTDVFSKIFPKADIIGKPGVKGGSYTCKYGENGICAACPEVGISQSDYQSHVSWYHLQPSPPLATSSSRMSFSTDNDSWSVLSSTVNLPAVLNDPGKGKQRDLFARSWGVDFVDSSFVSSSPHVCELPPNAFDRYLRKLQMSD